ncbi:hypothetical protein O4H52_20190 [Sphingomonadaceae bacterium G21617-S1]|jgi:hypothetical protein|nr:hypothetical protein [Sphingomonadaceae bacterium G21617-S1]|tara:strand:+ start:585 stop:746 length:162 start_codon:yes stop_codon:yes gene_type:complete
MAGGRSRPGADRYERAPCDATIEHNIPKLTAILEKRQRSSGATFVNYANEERS